MDRVKNANTKIWLENFVSSNIFFDLAVLSYHLLFQFIRQDKLKPPDQNIKYNKVDKIIIKILLTLGEIFRVDALYLRKGVRVYLGLRCRRERTWFIWSRRLNATYAEVWSMNEINTPPAKNKIIIML